MLRFNILGNILSRHAKTLFQYILCYGSTLTIFLFCSKKLRFQYILCYGSTFTLDFSDTYGKVFQYILCYGSTQEEWTSLWRKANFNTSYVTVQLRIPENLSKFIVEFQYILCYGSTISRSTIS